MKYLVLLISLIISPLTGLLFGQNGDYPPKSFAQFRRLLTQVTENESTAERDNVINGLWEKLKADRQIPFRAGDSVAFLYRGEADSVSWAGDFNGWRPNSTGYEGTRVGPSDIWMAVQRFPADARFDYKIIVDGKWILDPANPNIQMSGMGPNSELRMPECRLADETFLAPDVIRGRLSDNFLVNSEKLGYSVNYRIYTPYNYAGIENLPVIYVTDGHEYADDEKGAMLTVLDNLIFSGDIKPVVAVFIDPREPGKPENNRRMQEYTCNQKFADFVGEELVPLIDKSYKTHACPDDRAILGTSLGGMNAAWFGATRINDFHLLGIQSPAFFPKVLETFGKLDWYPFRIYMTTGLFSDTQKQALEMKAILDRNQVPFIYKEVNEGHSWGAWKAQLADMLRYFFGNGE